MYNKNTLGLVFFPAFDWKISPTHPERQERLLYTRDQLLEEGLLEHPAIREYNPLLASWQDIERVHVGAPSLKKWVTEAHRVSVGGAALPSWIQMFIMVMGHRIFFTTIRILYLSPSIKTGAPYIRVPGLCMNMVGLKRSVQP